MILMRATSITRAIGKCGSQKIETFLGPEMTMGPKSILYPVFPRSICLYSAAGNMWADPGNI